MFEQLVIEIDVSFKKFKRGIKNDLIEIKNLALKDMKETYIAHVLQRDAKRVYGGIVNGIKDVTNFT